MAMTTRERIVRAAAAAFAQRGYRAATVREICRRARVNVAAVNYHFGGKRALYQAVFAYLFTATADQDLLLVAPPSGRREDWQTFLRDWVRAMVAATTRPPPLEELKLRLLCREMLDTSEVFPELFAAYMAPRIAILKRGFSAVLPQPVTEQELTIRVFSVLAQGLFYFQYRPLIAAARPGEGFPDDDVEAIAAAIVHNVL